MMEVSGWRGSAIVLHIWFASPFSFPLYMSSLRREQERCISYPYIRNDFSPSIPLPTGNLKLGWYSAVSEIHLPSSFKAQVAIKGRGVSPKTWVRNLYISSRVGDKEREKSHRRRNWDSFWVYSGHSHRRTRLTADGWEQSICMYVYMIHGHCEAPLVENRNISLFPFHYQALIDHVREHFALMGNILIAMDSQSPRSGRSLDHQRLQ